MSAEIEDPTSPDFVLTEESDRPFTPVTAALFAAVVLGCALVWHFTAPTRAFNRGLTLLYRAQSSGDRQTAAAALRAFKPYVDSTGQGYDWLFEAAALAGDDATAAAYDERLMRSVPKGGSAILIQYENALFYHAVNIKQELAAFNATDDPAKKNDLLEKIRAHCDAAAALKPTRAKAVEAFDNGIPKQDAARLLKIDEMHRELDDADPTKPADAESAPASDE